MVSYGGSGSGLALQAATPAAGYPLVNGTGTIITWTAPADGKNHRFELIGEKTVTSAETGGQVNIEFTDPAGTARNLNAFNGGLGTGTCEGFEFNGQGRFVVQSGSAVTLVQDSALTGGASVVYAELWAS